MARRKPLDVSFGAKRVNPEDTLESGLPPEARRRTGKRDFSVKVPRNPAGTISAPEKTFVQTGVDALSRGLSVFGGGDEREQVQRASDIANAIGYVTDPFSSFEQTGRNVREQLEGGRPVTTQDYINLATPAVAELLGVAGSRLARTAPAQRFASWLGETKPRLVDPDYIEGSFRVAPRGAAPAASRGQSAIVPRVGGPGSSLALPKSSTPSFSAKPQMVPARDLIKYAVHTGRAGVNEEIDPKRAAVNEALRVSIAQEGVREPVKLLIDDVRGTAMLSNGNHRVNYAYEIDPDMMVPVEIDRFSGKRAQPAGVAYDGRFDVSAPAASTEPLQPQLAVRPTPLRVTGPEPIPALPAPSVTKVPATPAEEGVDLAAKGVAGKIRVAEIPISQIEHGESALPGGALTWPDAKETILDYASRKTEMPPIGLIRNEPDDVVPFMVYDGSHRLEAAKLKGQSNIKAVVLDPEVDWGEAMKIVDPNSFAKPTGSLSVTKVPATVTPIEEGVDLAARRAAGEALIGAESPFMISTRRPTPGRGGVNFAVYGNPDEQLLVQSGEALRASPAAFAKNMQMLSEEPFAARVAGKSPEEIYDYATEQGARNLEFITNELMPPEKVQAAREWYPVAKMVSERAAERSGFAPQVGYGVTAVTSPQAPWDINVAKMERLLDLYRGGFDANPEDVVAWARRRMEDPKRAGAVAPLGEDYLRRITETPISDLPIGFDRYAKVVSADAALNDPMVRRILLSGEYGEPYGPITWGSSSEINKALNILSDPTMANVSRQMEGGGKVPSFYNNIAAPFSVSPIATIDTHSAGAYSLFPGGGKDPIVYRAMGLSGTPGAPGAADVAATGSKGLYGPVVEAHRLAGERLGFLPREVQSATWEGVRDLWGQSGKTAALKKDIADIWRTSSSPDEARFRIAERLGKPLRRVFKVK